MVIPAINCKDSQTARRQIATARAFSEWIHIDIVDGVFAPATTWGSPGEVRELKVADRGLKIEAHLMVENPEEVLTSWLEAGVERVIVHAEVLRNERLVAQLCARYGVEAVLAGGPTVTAEMLAEYREYFSFYQVLSVTPGFAGQKFGDEAIEKIRALLEKVPNATIEVDGGVNPETAARTKQAGAKILVSASYIFGSADPQQAYGELVTAVS